MTRSVIDVAEKHRIGAGEGEDPLCDIRVLELAAAADVVHLPRSSVPQDELDRRTVIPYVKPIPRLAAVAVKGHRPSVERVRHEQRDHLLRVLEWPVRIRPPGDHGVDPERAHMREHLEIPAGLGRRVRARRADAVALS